MAEHDCPNNQITPVEECVICKEEAMSKHDAEAAAEDFGRKHNETAFTKKREDIPFWREFADCWLTGWKARDAAAQAEMASLREALQERNREAVKAAENYDRINGIRNDLIAENARLREALRYIARDEAAIESDCAHDQADMYVAKAREALAPPGREGGEG